MRPKIVVSLMTEKQSYQQHQASAARAAAGPQVDLEVLFADGIPGVQTQQLTRYIDAPVDERPFAMVVEPMTADGQENLGQRVAEAGIGWILLDSPPYIEYLNFKYPKVPIASVSANNHQIGTIQAQQYRRLLPWGGRLLYVEGTATNPATIDRRRAMMNGIEHTGMTVKAIAADWTRARAKDLVAAWLRLPSALRPDLVGAQNDSMALGALDAIKSAKPEWTPLTVAGVDGLPDEGEKLVKEGVLSATVVMTSTAAVAVQLAMRAMSGERISPATVPVHSFPPIERLKPPEWAKPV